MKLWTRCLCPQGLPSGGHGVCPLITIDLWILILVNGLSSLLVHCFDVQIDPDLPTGSSDWLLSSFDMSPPLLKHFLLPGTLRCSRLLWYFPCPSQPFLQSTVFHFKGDDIYRPGSWQVIKMYVYNFLYIFRDLSQNLVFVEFRIFLFMMLVFHKCLAIWG